MDDFLVMEVTGREGGVGPGRLGVALDYVSGGCRVMSFWQNRHLEV